MFHNTKKQWLFFAHPWPTYARAARSLAPTTRRTRRGSCSREPGRRPHGKPGRGGVWAVEHADVLGNSWDFMGFYGIFMGFPGRWYIYMSHQINLQHMDDYTAITIYGYQWMINVTIYVTIHQSIGWWEKLQEHPHEWLKGKYRWFPVFWFSLFCQPIEIGKMCESSRSNSWYLYNDFTGIFYIYWSMMVDVWVNPA